MDPVLIDLGFIEIRWYSILILIAVVISTIFVIKEAKRFSIDVDTILNLICLVVIFGIIGARIYFVLFNLDYYKENPSEIFKIWNGGLAIHGGIIAGVITTIIYCKKVGIKVLRILDIAAPWLLLSQAIGRWGNFFNGEAYGARTTLEHLQSLPIPDFIIDGMYINGAYYTPTFLYESLWCLLGFVILMVARRIKYTKLGQLTAMYCIWYGVGRFMIEASRLDSLMLGNIKVAQLASILLIIGGVILFIYEFNKKGKEYWYNNRKLK